MVGLVAWLDIIDQIMIGIWERRRRFPENLGLDCGGGADD